MKDLESKYVQMIKAFALLRKYKKMSRERRDELRSIVMEYLAQLNDDELNKLIKKAKLDGEEKPELCDQIICAFISVLDEIIFGEIVKIIGQFDTQQKTIEPFKPASHRSGGGGSTPPGNK